MILTTTNSVEGNRRVGIKIDIEPLSNSNKLLVSVTGTAVNIVSEK